MIRFFNFYLANHSFPLHKFPTIWELGTTIVHQFMRRSSSWRGGISARPESAYRDEVYRLLLACLSSKSVSVASPRSRAKRVDFLLPDQGWGFDVIKEGRKLAEIGNRFIGHGAYTDWMLTGRLRQWLILDCWTEMPPEYGKLLCLLPVKEDLCG